MKIKGQHKRTIWVDDQNEKIIHTFDQRYFPHEVRTVELKCSDDAAKAIKEMWVRGAPLIGATAAYGLYLAAVNYSGDDLFAHLNSESIKLNATRPTAVNLYWALQKMLLAVDEQKSNDENTKRLLKEANSIVEDDVESCRMIGVHGLKLIEEISQKKNGEPVNILTHCNAGWLACIDWGTATSPVYQAHAKGIKVHVYVDETRPRNQGANLTSFELNEQGVPHTLIVDNTGGHLMQHGMVDIVITGTDRTTRSGDVANKIGTYLKALAALDNNIPFYVALPSSTLDWNISDGLKEIEIETRDPHEVKYIFGKSKNGLEEVLICPEDTPAINYGFDVTPARLISGLITERGICEASEKGLTNLFPEHQ